MRARCPMPGMSRQTARPAPGSSMIRSAQAVPSATLLPCITALPSGWQAGGADTSSPSPATSGTPGASYCADAAPYVQDECPSQGRCAS